MNRLALTLSLLLFAGYALAAEDANSEVSKKEANKLISEFETFFSLCKEVGTVSVAEIEMTKRLGDDSVSQMAGCIEKGQFFFNRNYKSLKAKVEKNKDVMSALNDYASSALSNLESLKVSNADIYGGYARRTAELEKENSKKKNFLLLQF